MDLVTSNTSLLVLRTGLMKLYHLHTIKGDISEVCPKNTVSGVDADKEHYVIYCRPIVQVIDPIDCIGFLTRFQHLF